MKKHYRVLATDYDNFGIEYMCNINMMGNVDGTFSPISFTPVICN